METIERKHNVATVKKTGDAVGVERKQWFVVIVNNNSERKCSETLTKMGYETYVPTQREIRQWCTGKKKSIDRILFPTLVFVRVEESERKKIVALSFINRFMTNRASRADEYNRHRIVVIPDYQIDTLKFMLYHSEQPVLLQPASLRLGDKVRVVRGSLKGIEGYISTCPSQNAYLSVGIDMLGFARVSIPLTDVIKI